jgi:ribosomal-protein-alanine N-acetyltransferase
MFFMALESSGSAATFHPHPFTAKEAQRIALYQGSDIYLVLLEGEVVLGYGMLRGWDEGYSVPSLGITIHPKFRGRGLSRVLLQSLHAAARQRGAQRVRLKVYPENKAAVRLYKSFGYAFEPQLECGQLLGYLSL